MSGRANLFSPVRPVIRKRPSPTSCYMTLPFPVLSRWRRIIALAAYHVYPGLLFPFGAQDRGQQGSSPSLQPGGEALTARRRLFGRVCAVFIAAREAAGRTTSFIMKETLIFARRCGDADRLAPVPTAPARAARLRACAAVAVLVEDFLTRVTAVLRRRALYARMTCGATSSRRRFSMNPRSPEAA